MTPYLFVYGTLRHRASNEMANYLRHHAEFIGTGTMPGRKFDLGWYPGAVYEKNAASLVSGDIYRMFRPAMVLKVLDLYEGVGETFGYPNEYRREEVPVSIERKSLSCWVYLYNLEIPV